MRQIDLTANELSSALLALAETENVCILDSCGVGHLGSHLMIAGIRPVEAIELRGEPKEVLNKLHGQLTNKEAAIFTIAYDLGPRLDGIATRADSAEPDVFVARFEALVVHDYATGTTSITGNEALFDDIESWLLDRKSVV